VDVISFFAMVNYRLLFAAQTFFHCRTGVKVRKDEVCMIDSDDDVDESWVQKQVRESTCNRSHARTHSFTVM
jgi:hypothetical protein